ncbi:hypothetical protein ACVXG7_10135 [Enterobacter hormaechei]
MGLMPLAQQSGAVSGVSRQLFAETTSSAARAGSSRQSISTATTLIPEEQRRDIVGVCPTVKTDDGDYLTHTMRIDAIYSIRDGSEAWKKYKYDNSKKCPWVTDEEQIILDGREAGSKILAAP